MSVKQSKKNVEVEQLKNKITELESINKDLKADFAKLNTKITNTQLGLVEVYKMSTGE